MVGFGSARGSSFDDGGGVGLVVPNLSAQTFGLDCMALILLFWKVYQPGRISLLVAFVVGVLVDVQQSSRMGEHALMYVWPSIPWVCWHHAAICLRVHSCLCMPRAWCLPLNYCARCFTS